MQEPKPTEEEQEQRDAINRAVLAGAFTAFKTVLCRLVPHPSYE